MNRNIVLDTNCLLQIIAKQSKNYFLWEGFLDGDYCLCYTNEILEEYEEILSIKANPVIASMVIEIIKRAPNSIPIDAHFHCSSADKPDGPIYTCNVINHVLPHLTIFTHKLHFNKNTCRLTSSKFTP